MNKFNFKKKYGQNFIKNKYIVEKMVNEAQIPDDTLVIEIGPGKGVLTEQIIKFARKVICYEIDKDLQPFLDEKFKNTDNINIIYDDFLNRNIEEDIQDYKFKYIYFIANVPYYITTPILMKIINLQENVNKIVMMIQKEVGDRLCASCGNKDYSSISVFLDYFFERKKLFVVDRSEFIPVPNVDSIVISLTRKDKLIKVDDYDFFFKIVRDSFQFKRKNIKNNLKDYNTDILSDVLAKYGFSLNSRAEEIPLSVFIDISNSLYKE